MSQPTFLLHQNKENYSHIFVSLEGHVQREHPLNSKSILHVLKEGKELECVPRQQISIISKPVIYLKMCGFLVLDFQTPCVMSNLSVKQVGEMEIIRSEDKHLQTCENK